MHESNPEPGAEDSRLTTYAGAERKKTVDSETVEKREFSCSLCGSCIFLRVAEWPVKGSVRYECDNCGSIVDVSEPEGDA